MRAEATTWPPSSTTANASSKPCLVASSMPASISVRAVSSVNTAADANDSAMPAWIRRLGRDGPPVSAIGLGLAALGRPGYLNVGHGADIGADRSVDAMRARCWQVLDAARAAGVVYFD